MKRNLLFLLLALLPIVASADEYTDPQSKVVYTYEPGQPTASVKAGYDEVVEPDYGSELMTDHYAGSPDASGDVVILDRFTVGTAEYVVTSIGEVAFRRNENIKSVSIPETVTTIGDYAFQNCDSLTSVQLPDGLTQIASGLFEGCEQLTSVAIPSSVITIGERAFDECSSLSSLTLPAGLTFIGSFAFNGTPWYNAQYNEAPDGLFYIGPQLVGYKGDKPTGNLTIKEGTTCVANSAFCNCTGLTSVTFPKTVTFVDTYAFENCTGLKAVHITDLAAWSSIEFQWSRIGSSNPLCYAYDLYLNGEKVSDIVIPEGVTRIGSHAFDHCGPLTSVVIPEGVTSIGENAFRSCISLTSVTIPSSMARIESQAFLWCKKLDAVHISDLAAWCRISLSDRTSNPLYYNARLYLKGDEVTDLVIPDGITRIGDYAFTQCPSLASVTIPEGVTSIGNHAFRNCSNLSSITIPEGVTSIGEYVFDGCSGLTSISLPKSLSSIGHCAFAHCVGLSSITIPEGVTSIGDFVFDGCSGLTSITIPTSLTDISHGTFNECTNLTSVTIPKSVTSVSGFAFGSCSNLADIYCYAEDVPTTEDRVFYGTPIASATLHVPAGSIDKYKATSPWNEFGNIVAIEGIAQEYFSEGTKWTEIRLDTLKYDSWYSKVGNEWVPNFETIEYYVKGEFVDAKFDVDNKFKCVYTNGPEWTDSLTLMILEDIRYEPNSVEVTVPLFRAYGGGSHLYVLPGRAYEFDWSVGQVLSFQTILGGNATCWCYWYNYGVIDEIKEGYFGGMRPLKYVDLDGKAPVDPEERPDFEDTNGCRIIQGIGVTEWNSGECIFGPVDPYFGGIALAEGPDTGKEVVRHYRSMLVHFERDGEVLYDVWPETPDNMVTFTENQMATIVLPTAPDASKGKYYRLDRCEDGQIIFEQELHPQAHIPYIIVPSEDFSIDPGALDLAGLSNDTVSIEGISFIGSYTSNELNEPEGFYIDIIDTTPDCGFSPSEGTGKKAFIGALRAYLQVSWDEPYNHGGSKAPGEKLEITLKDYGTGITEPSRPSPDPSLYGGEVYDLQGRKIGSGKSFPLKGARGSGIYIEGGKKKVK